MAASEDEFPHVEDWSPTEVLNEQHGANVDAMAADARAMAEGEHPHGRGTAPHEDPPDDEPLDEERPDGQDPKPGDDGPRRSMMAPPDLNLLALLDDAHKTAPLTDDVPKVGRVRPLPSVPRRDSPALELTTAAVGTEFGLVVIDALEDRQRSMMVSKSQAENLHAFATSRFLSTLDRTSHVWQEFEIHDGYSIYLGAPSSAGATLVDDAPEDILGPCSVDGTLCTLILCKSSGCVEEVQRWIPERMDEPDVAARRWFDMSPAPAYVVEYEPDLADAKLTLYVANNLSSQ